MTKVMWLGEDAEGYAGPSHIIWNGIKFPKDVAVEVTDQQMLGKAKGNQYFQVIEGKQEDSHGESQTQDKEQEQDKEQGKEQNKTGYSPVKKRVRKKKAPAQDRAQDRADDTTAA